MPKVITGLKKGNTMFGGERFTKYLNMLGENGLDSNFKYRLSVNNNNNYIIERQGNDGSWSQLAKVPDGILSKKINIYR